MSLLQFLDVVVVIVCLFLFPPTMIGLGGGIGFVKLCSTTILTHSCSLQYFLFCNHNFFFSLFSMNVILVLLIAGTVSDLQKHLML